MSENALADDLEAIADELRRHGWPVAPIDYAAPNIVLTARLATEERRLRALTESIATAVDAQPGHADAQLGGRYWPTGIGAPTRPDGTVDIPALGRLYDDLVNNGLGG